MIGVVKIIKLQIIYCLKQNLKSVINALCEIKSADMRKKEAETCTSIKSQENDITVGRKSPRVWKKRAC